MLLSGPEIDIPIMRKFKLDNVDYVLLTYSDCPHDFDPLGIVAAVTGTGAVYRLGRELHQSGKPHYHCFVQWIDGGHSDDDARRTFCVDGRYPNIKRFSANPGRRWDYVGKYAGQKEGHYIIGDQCDRPGGDSDEPRGEADKWSEIINATTQDEFFEKCASLAPKQLGCNFGSLKLYAEWKYRPAAKEYISPVGEYTPSPEMQTWVDEYILNEFGGRYVSTRSPLPRKLGGGPSLQVSYLSWVAGRIYALAFGGAPTPACSALTWVA